MERLSENSPRFDRAELRLILRERLRRGDGVLEHSARQARTRLIEII